MIAPRVIIDPPNKYGYTLDVNNPTINRLYDHYIKARGIRRPPSDKERLEFERRVKRILVREYKAVYKDELVRPVIGWQRERLNDLTVGLDVTAVKNEVV